MKKEITVGGTQINIRGLTWGEKAQLKKDGCNIAYLDPRKDNDELVEKVVKVVCGDNFDFSKYDSGEIYGMFAEIHKLTFLTGLESKN